MLRWYAEQGYRCEIYTARPACDRGAIWDWIRGWHLPVDAVTCDKPFGGLFIDDRAYCPDYTKRVLPVKLAYDEGDVDEV